MIINIVINFFGAFLFFYLFWKKLKEDYPSSSIFSICFYLLFGIGLGYLISLKFFPHWWFWSEFAGSLLGVTAGLLKYKFRPYEAIEAAILALLPWLGLVFFKDSIVRSSLSSFLAFFSVVCLLTLFAFLDSHYKYFAWYKSGKLGFSGLVTIFFFFLLRAGFAPFFPNVISFSGKWETAISGTMAFIIFLIVYNLARKSP